VVEYTPETGVELATNEENDAAAVVTQEKESVQQANCLLSKTDLTDTTKPAG